MELHGSVALVTGGARRLGRAIVLALGQAGANVVVHYYKSEAQAQATVEELVALGVQATAVGGDLGSVAAVERVVDAAVERWGRLNLLVNSAGIWGPIPLNVSRLLTQ